MSPRSKREYIQAIVPRYAAASKPAKRQILDEVCATTGYHRKAAIRRLRQAQRAAPTPPRHRLPTYDPSAVTVLSAIWEAAGYPWAVRLKALLPLWLPWAKQRFAVSTSIEQQLLRMSPSTIDRRLHGLKHQLKRRFYGRTKPGTLLKHQIPVRTEHWDVTTPGFTEVDLVSHSGNSADGEFLQSVNLTDIHTGWVETRAVLSKGHTAVSTALAEIRARLPFALLGLDSDNGSEFINNHLFHYCEAEGIQFTRGRPYKKDDNAHIEQKNWTHVRKVLGWDRYDSPAALAAINDLYGNELRLMMNLFQPSVKLVRKIRRGSRLTRRYDAPQTPLDRLVVSGKGDPAQIARLTQLRSRLDPFTLAETIDRKLRRIYRLTNRRQSPRPLAQLDASVTLPLNTIPSPPLVRPRMVMRAWSHRPRAPVTS